MVKINMLNRLHKIAALGDVEISSLEKQVKMNCYCAIVTIISGPSFFKFLKESTNLSIHISSTIIVQGSRVMVQRVP